MSKHGSRRGRTDEHDDPTEELSRSRPSGDARAVSPELARIAPAALVAALEAIAAPAFVVKAPATVLHANTRGRALLDGDRERVLGALDAAGDSTRAPSRFEVDGLADHFVAVFPDIPGDATQRIAGVARRWGLTPRQAAVLEVVAQGASNRAVAERLGCSEKTVELHVSALLAKTRCAGRARLVASFWTEQG